MSYITYPRPLQSHLMLVWTTAKNMLNRIKNPSILENFKLAVNQYLRETTVHGFRYLVDGRNVCETVVWSIVISFCFVLTFFGIILALFPFNYNQQH